MQLVLNLVFHILPPFMIIWRDLHFFFVVDPSSSQLNSEFCSQYYTVLAFVCLWRDI